MTIDELIVSLGLDASKFTQGQTQAMAAFKRTQEEARRRANDIEESAKRSQQVIGRVTTEAVSMFAALAGASGIKQFVTNMVQGDAATSRLARTLNVSATQLRTFTQAGEQLGIKAEDMAATMAHLKDLVDRLRGVGGGPLGAEEYRPFAQLFAQGGEDISRIKTGTELLIAAARAADRIRREQGPDRAAAVVRQLPYSPDVQAAILGGAAKVAEALKDAGQNLPPTPEHFDRMEAYIKRWERLGALVKNIGAAMLDNLDKATGGGVGDRYEKGLRQLGAEIREEKPTPWWHALVVALTGPFAPLIIGGGKETPAAGKSKTPAAGESNTIFTPKPPPPEMRRVPVSPVPDISGVDVDVQTFGAPQAAGTRPGVSHSSNDNSTVTEVNVNGPITINTRAPDGAGTGAEIKDALLSYGQRRARALGFEGAAR